MIGYVSRIAAEKNVDVPGRRPGAGRRRPARGAVPVRRRRPGAGRPRSDGWGRAPRFVGYRSGEDLADHYAAADLFAFASLTETFGNVVLEAMASGLPVVALRAGGVGDIVQPGVTGLLLDADATPRLVRPGRHDAGRRRRTARRYADSARAYALSQSWDTIMGMLRDRYLHVIGPESPRMSAPALIS